MGILLSLLIFAVGGIVVIAGLIFFVTYAQIVAGKIAWKKWLLILLGATVTLGIGAFWSIAVYEKSNVIVPIVLLSVTALVGYFSFLILWYRFKGFRVAFSIILSLLIVTIPIVIISWIAYAFTGKTEYQTEENCKEIVKEKQKKEDKKGKIKSLKIKSKQGNLDALCDLADCYLSHPYYSYRKNKNLYMKAAKKGSARAQFWVSENAYRYIKVDKEDENKYNKEKNAIKLKWLKKSAEQGYAKAMCKLGEEYCGTHSEIVDQNYEEAEKWLLAAAKKGNAEAQHKLGLYYSSNVNKNKKKDEKKSFEWFLKAAKGGIVLAQYFVAEEYLKGKTIEKDAEQAVFWLEKAANKKYLDAMIKLVNIYMDENEVVYNLEKSDFWRKKVENSKEYKERRESVERARRLTAASRSVDYASITARTNETLKNMYGGAAIVGSNNDSNKTWNDIEGMRIANNISDRINDPNYDVAGFPDSSDIW